MAMQKRFAVGHGDVFPSGAFLKGFVEPVADFQAAQGPDGQRPQQRDKETGLPLWQCTVIDFDAEASKKETVLTVKFAAPHQPVPPVNNSGFPLTPVEFVGLTALPYVDDSGNRPRIAWSYRAEDLVEPGKAGKASPSSPAREA